jgi:hypothetical protein
MADSVTWLTIPVGHRTHLARRVATVTVWRATLLFVATVACGRAETGAPVQSPRGGSGSIAWRAYSTGPDSELLIGLGFRPFYASDRAKHLGVSTWSPDQWRLGGGTVRGRTWKPALYLQSLGEQPMASGGQGPTGGPTESTRRRQPSGAGGQR